MKKVSGGSGFGWLLLYAVMDLVMVAMLVACVTGKVVRIANGTLATIVVLLLLFGVVGCFCKVKALWKQLHGTTASASVDMSTTATPPVSAGTSTTVATPASAGTVEKKLSRRYLEAWRAEVEDSLVEANEILTEAEEAEDEYKSAKLEYEAALQKARSRRKP